MTVRIQTEVFDVGAELKALHAANPKIGAIASFVGLARDVNDGQSVETLRLEHYPGMTERALEDIIRQAQARWDVMQALIIHRVGLLAPLDPIVLVVVCSMHRHDAFDACRFLIDYLKTDAPFWKHEAGPGGAHWVDARASDDVARAAWVRATGKQE